MDNLVHTLIVNTKATSTTALADILAQDVASAAADGTLMIQKNGAFQTGDASTASATDYIRLSTAHTMPDKTISVVGSSEFVLGDIYSVDYAPGRTNALANTVYVQTVNAVREGGLIYVRLEHKDGRGVKQSETFSGSNYVAIKNQFNKMKSKGLTAFDYIVMTHTPTNETVIVSAYDSDSYSDVYVSASKGAVINNNGYTRSTPLIGSTIQAQALEKRSHISAGAYNQVGHLIKVPSTSANNGEVYGIFTIELRKKVAKRFVHETIKILIADDAAPISGGQKTLAALQAILGLNVYDVTPPTLSDISFANASSVPYAETYSIADATTVKVLATGLSVGDAYVFTLLSSNDTDTGHNTVIAKTPTSTSEFVSFGINSSAFTAGSVLSVTYTAVDTNGNTLEGAMPENWHLTITA